VRVSLAEVIALLKTHTEHDGSYCDTGEDMDWACRSECVEMAVKRLRERFTSVQSVDVVP
jgi:hypothetical protein